MTKARILADYVAGGTTAAEFDYMDGVTSNVQTQMNAKAPLASPTFTGTANLSSGVTMPTGHITNVIKHSITDDIEYANSGTTAIVSFDAVTFPGISGKIYIIHSLQNYCAPTIESNSTTITHQENQLYCGTDNKSQGDAQSGNTLIARARTGLHDTAVSSRGVYFPWTAVGVYTATSTATHYVYLTTLPHDGGDVKARHGATTQYPWTTIIYEVTP